MPKDCKKPCMAFVICGASIICPNYVITAAHCSYNYKKIEATPIKPSYDVIVAEAKPSDQVVMIGIHDLLKDKGKEYAIESITIHPTFANNNDPVYPPREMGEADCDVSLYKLKTPID